MQIAFSSDAMTAVLHGIGGAPDLINSSIYPVKLEKHFSKSHNFFSTLINVTYSLKSCGSTIEHEVYTWQIIFSRKMGTSSHSVRSKLYLHFNCSQVQTHIIKFACQIFAKFAALQMLQKIHGSVLMKSNFSFGILVSSDVVPFYFLPIPKQYLQEDTTEKKKKKMKYSPHGTFILIQLTSINFWNNNLSEIVCGQGQIWERSNISRHQVKYPLRGGFTDKLSFTALSTYYFNGIFPSLTG